LPEVVRVKLKRQIVSRLGGGIVDADLKHRKTALQFDLQAPIDFKSETVLGQFNRPEWHSETVVFGNVSYLVKVSLAGPTSLFC
jgi:hypothetical protein